MGLYLGLVSYWIVGIYKAEHWKNSTLTCTLFMGGLAIGRIISIIIDGIPSLAFSFETLAEIIFMLWGILSLRKSV
jgi:hypothetical protein